VEYTRHATLRDIDRNCSRKLLPGKVAPSPRGYLVTVVPAFDNDYRVDDGIPSKHPFVDSAAVRQNIHEREDAYRDVEDLLVHELTNHSNDSGRFVLPIAIMLKSFVKG
jgi:hypothetical protein